MGDDDICVQMRRDPRAWIKRYCFKIAYFAKFRHVKDPQCIGYTAHGKIIKQVYDPQLSHANTLAPVQR